MFLQEVSNWFFSSSIWTMVITGMLISATNLYPHLAPTSAGFDQWDPCRRGGRGLPSRHMRGGSEIVMAVSTFLLQRAPEQWILHLPWEAGACSWVEFFGLFFPTNIQNCHLVSLEFRNWGGEKNLVWEAFASSSLLTSQCWALFFVVLF